MFKFFSRITKIKVKKIKKIICDSSSLISMSDNCLLCVLRGLKKELIITSGIADEIIKNPYETKKFKLKAIQLESLIKDGTITIMDHPKLKEETEKVLELANSLLEIDGRKIKIIQQGEAEAIALYKLINADALLIDERTARHFIEDATKIKDYMESRLNRGIKINESIRKQIENKYFGIEVIRSAEIIAFAYERGQMNKCGMPSSLEAGLYAVKFSGCSITEEEIEEYKRILK